MFSRPHVKARPGSVMILDQQLPRDFLAIPSKKLATILGIHPVNYFHEFGYRVLRTEKLAFRYIALEGLGQIGVNGSRVQQNAGDGILSSAELHSGALGHWANHTPTTHTYVRHYSLCTPDPVGTNHK